MKRCFLKIIDVYKSYIRYFLWPKSKIIRNLKILHSKRDRCNAVKNEWTAIVCLWKRESYLIEQLDAISCQSVPPNEIIIVQNEKHFCIPEEIRKKYSLSVIASDKNSLYLRWLVGYLAGTKYVCVFDDDVIPGRLWVERCIKASAGRRLLIGASGRKYKAGMEKNWVNILPTKGDGYQYCDWVCNSYFFESEWIGHICSIQRYKDAINTYDDIHLAISLKIFNSVNSVVLTQPTDSPEMSGNIKREYGRDKHALWMREEKNHLKLRVDYIREIERTRFEWC